MTSQCSVELGSSESKESKAVLKREDGGLASFFCRISQFWPVRLVVHGFQAFWWFFGFSSPGRAPSPPSEEDKSSHQARPCRSGRKRLGRTTRLLLSILPRQLQSALGYPVCTSIGCSVSPEVRCSPTKPCGKGSKRKQDDLDEDEELEQQSWVEALSQELTDEDQSADPDYEPSTVESNSEEYQTHNSTESDIEVEKGGVVIKDLEIVQWQPVHTRTVRRCTQEADEALQDCFESTDWDVLCEPHGEDISDMTDCITEYIRFCDYTIMPTQTVHCFPNNKPWITSDLKALLNRCSGLETEKNCSEQVLEILVLTHLRPQVKVLLDPLQFAYQPHLLRCRRDQYRKSFLPQAIILYNNSPLSDRENSDLSTV
ncbi:oogenesis-related [Neoarius graeffei]|uniref:oogenesis-related n=1 Tax=Neoarius graeffei TaxID=443677 RepID=UPI00298C72BA|nr:oogenesis-related [Neoarius graeffei]